ncbi:hypothetical protein ACDI96_09450, partial [Citrobacter telavivensis]
FTESALRTFCAIIHPNEKRMEYPPTSLLAVGGGLYLCSSQVHDYSLNACKPIRLLCVSMLSRKSNNP